jgi:hypothetical protein
LGSRHPNFADSTLRSTIFGEQPQLLSIYAIAYYIGSITRYRPHQYDDLEISAYGPRILDFVTGQPIQFLYMMASEFIRQDVTKPAIL